MRFASLTAIFALTHPHDPRYGEALQHQHRRDTAQGAYLIPRRPINPCLPSRRYGFSFSFFSVTWSLTRDIVNFTRISCKLFLVGSREDHLLEKRRTLGPPAYQPAPPLPRGCRAAYFVRTGPALVVILGDGSPGTLDTDQQDRADERPQVSTSDPPLLLRRTPRQPRGQEQRHNNGVVLISCFHVMN